MTDTTISNDQLAAVIAAQPQPGLVAALNTAIAQFEINSDPRVAMFVAETAYESGGYRRMVENMNYSAERLMEVFPSHFPTMETAEAVARDPVATANIVYGGRLGNTEPGDGARFIGRGFIQITGRANYMECGRALGVDLHSGPDFLATLNGAAMSAAWFWQAHGCNELADKDDIQGATRRINGGLSGIAARTSLYIKAREQWPG